jgi:hypothetical protein
MKWFVSHPMLFGCLLTHALACRATGSESGSESGAATEGGATDGTTTDGTTQTQTPPVVDEGNAPDAGTWPKADVGAVDEPLPEGCECGDTDACGMPVCPHIVLSDDFYDPTGGDTDAESDASEAIDCALQALRDRGPGNVSWELSQYNGQNEFWGRLSMFGDGTASMGTSYVEDFCYSLEATISHVALAEPAFYEECRNLPDLFERLDCLRFGDEVIMTCVDGGEECKDGV